MNEILAVAREPQGPEDTPEKLEEEQLAAQHFIDTGNVIVIVFATYCCDVHCMVVLQAEPLTPEELQLKEELTEQGFPDWSRRDFQQLIRGLEAHGWYDEMIFSPIVRFLIVFCFVLIRSADHETLAEEIQEKTAAEVKKYYKVFKKEWKTLAGTSCSFQYLVYLYIYIHRSVTN